MSQAKLGDIVRVHYVLKLDNGKVLDDSASREPLQFMLGGNRLVPAFESAVIGMSAGETKTVMISTEQAGGPHRKELLFKVDRRHLPANLTPRIGQRANIRQYDDCALLAVVTEITDSYITLDANSPLAGMDLIYELQLLEIVSKGDNMVPMRDQTAEIRSAPQSIGKQESGSTGNGKCVLIIDDDPEIRSLLELALEEEGYAVQVAANGLEGLQEVRRNTPDLILLDLGMPVMNGREFARGLRVACGRRVPIMVLTAANYDQKMALEIDPIKWLSKPFNLDRLLQDVAKTTA